MPAAVKLWGSYCAIKMAWQNNPTNTSWDGADRQEDQARGFILCTEEETTLEHKGKLALWLSCKQRVKLICGITPVAFIQWEHCSNPTCYAASPRPCGRLQPPPSPNLGHHRCRTWAKMTKQPRRALHLSGLSPCPMDFVSTCEAPANLDGGLDGCAHAPHGTTLQWTVARVAGRAGQILPPPAGQFEVG